MSFKSFDRFIEKYSFISDYFRLKVISLFNTTPMENICFPAAAVFACGIFNFKEFGILSAAVFVIMLLSWILSSLLSGFLKRWYFIGFSAAFNLLPHVFINTAEKEVDAVNEILAFISRLTVIYANNPLIESGADPFAVSAAITVGTALFMILGFIIRRKLKNSHAYCRIRLSMLDSDKN